MSRLRLAGRSLTRALGWNRGSYVLMSAFAAVILLIMYVWWPLVQQYWATADPRQPIWKQMDWLLLGNFGVFYALLLAFVWPTIDKSLTIAALILCALLILSPTDHRGAVLTFAAGTALGYFLERWGTTRACWIYYTHEIPPVFAVLAHGM